MAHAISAAQGEAAAWTEICTSAGVVRFAAANTDTQDRTGSSIATAAVDCPFCSTHAGSFALPGVSGAAIPAAEPFRPRPDFDAPTPRPLFRWASARPRAPPAS